MFVGGSMTALVIDWHVVHRLEGPEALYYSGSVAPHGRMGRGADSAEPTAVISERDSGEWQEATQPQSNLTNLYHPYIHLSEKRHGLSGIWACGGALI